MEISVIVRFKNEAEYLNAVLSAVNEQSFPKDQYEIIAVDNYSDDDSAKIAGNYTSKLIQTKSYRPGKALNEAIRYAEGRFICLLSAHTIPANRHWLQKLYDHMQTPNLAGVYGAQLYPVNSEFLDKRDLDIFSTLTPRIEKQDADFWNANSMFSRKLWEMQPFEETVYELEDHYWTKLLLPKGFVVHFEPSALVYHYSHIQRLDRTFLPPSELSDYELYNQAKETLSKTPLDWPEAMKAGLTMNSLSHLPELPEVVHLIGNQLLNNPDFDVRWRMAQAMSKIRTPESVKYLVSALSDPSYYSRDEATWSLAKLGALAVKAVIEEIPSLQVEAVPFAALALGKSGVIDAEKEAVALFLSEINSNDSKRQADAIHFAGEIAGIKDSARLVLPIFNLLTHDDLHLQMVCAWALGRFAQLTDDVSNEQIEKLRDIALSHPFILVRFEALVAFGKWGIRNKSEAVFDWLINRLVHEPNERVKYGAAQCLRLAMQKHTDLLLDIPFYYNRRDFGVKYEIEKIRSLSPVHKV